MLPDKLQRHNCIFREPARIRLRVAADVGPVGDPSPGWPGVLAVALGIPIDDGLRVCLSLELPGNYAAETGLARVLCPDVPRQLRQRVCVTERCLHDVRRKSARG